MATRLESWRNAVYNDLLTYLRQSGYEDAERLAASEVDALVCLAEAEGAEQERERIVQGSERIPEGASANYSQYFGIAWNCPEENPGANCELFIIPAPVLAPKVKP